MQKAPKKGMEHMRIIASDFDGTLCQMGPSWKYEVAPRDLSAIDAWRAAGNLFAVVTGRRFPDMRNTLESIGLRPDFLLCVNGSELYDSHFAPVASLKVDGGILSEIWPVLRPDALIGRAICGEDFYHLHNEEDVPPEDGIQVYSLEDMVRVIPCFTQVTTAYQTEEIAAARTEALRALPNLPVTPHQNGRFIDTVSNDGGKALGLSLAMTSLGITPEETYTLGDNQNDLPMLKAYRGYAIASGAGAVLAAIPNHVPNIAALIKEVM